MGSENTNKVSIIMPTYNRAEYIREALESLANQTFQDFEALIVDDGSTDNTKAIVSEYDPEKYKYIYTDHAGPAYARNTGMQEATGEYVCYLDSDDAYYPYKLELQVFLMDKYRDIVMLYTNFSAFDNQTYFDEKHLKTYHKSAYKKQNLTYEKIFDYSNITEFPVKICEEIPAELLNECKTNVYFGNIYLKYLQDMIVFTNSMMFRRRILNITGLQSHSFGHFHDMEFALRICKSGKIAFLDIPTYMLRYHEGQISTTNKSDGWKVAIKKQTDLLHVIRTHSKLFLEEIEKKGLNMNKLENKLCCAVAIPMISNVLSSAERNKTYSIRARKYLCRPKMKTLRVYYIFVLSYMPHLIKRAGFKFLSFFDFLFKNNKKI